MLYEIKNATVSAGGQVILSHIDFEIKAAEKIAVVGRNGAGKTTLLRLLAGELTPDRDDKSHEAAVRSSRRLTIGMLRQSNPQDMDKTVEELLLESCPQRDSFSKERFTYEMEYDRLFTGFGFAKQEKNRRLSSFSGGEQTKISLIRLLLMKPDILLLDEPTNHLDIPTVQWLEEYMRSYEKAVVFVSHDRFFLDRVVEVVYELQNGRLIRYVGNYSHYREQKQKDIARQRKAYEQQQAERRRLEQLIEQFKHKPTKAAFARSRKTMLARMEQIEKPQEDEAHIFTGDITPTVLGSKWVYEAEELKIGYDRELLTLSLRVRRGQKIGIIGDNGVGKSTFLKTVAGFLEPLAGKGQLGEHTLMGYFDQQTALLDSDKQVAAYFHDLFPAMQEKDVRQLLGAYLFRGRDASKRVSDLSGGEKARLVLAQMLTSRPNLLVLDEPTNHMDIPAKETLESAFRAYQGTILFVSHDRYFIRQVADAILVFEGQRVMYYPFGYEHYLSHQNPIEGKNLSALMEAESQAMLADLRAVPKGERGRLREIGTEEMYVDWKLSLAAQPMERARQRVELLWQQYDKMENELAEANLVNWVEGQGGQAENLPDQKQTALAQELASAWDEWTRCCMDWLEILEE